MALGNWSLKAALVSSLISAAPATAQISFEYDEICTSSQVVKSASAPLSKTEFETRDRAYRAWRATALETLRDLARRGVAGREALDYSLSPKQGQMTPSCRRKGFRNKCTYTAVACVKTQKRILASAPTCAEAVQGKIAWDERGSKQWAASNVERLCLGAEDDEPAKCFQEAMHGERDRGGKRGLNWPDAVNLCERTINAYRTVSCFDRKIADGVNSADAIRTCQWW